mmetsp:Transcript_50036/g.128791  ORF Transcript_50036/g.128791 Transcript_50036/m.128791 type:complete len:201 (-) Transcript_50036:252-854(-)
MAMLAKSVTIASVFIVAVYSFPVPLSSNSDCDDCKFAVGYFRDHFFASDYTLNTSLVGDAQYCMCSYGPGSRIEDACNNIMGPAAQLDTDSYYNSWSDNQAVCESMGYCDADTTSKKVQGGGDNGYIFCQLCPTIASYLKSNVPYPIAAEEAGATSVCLASHHLPGSKARCVGKYNDECATRPFGTIGRFLDGLCPYLSC